MSHLHREHSEQGLALLPESHLRSLSSRRRCPQAGAHPPHAACYLLQVADVGQGCQRSGEEARSWRLAGTNGGKERRLGRLIGMTLWDVGGKGWWQSPGGREPERKRDCAAGNSCWPPRPHAQPRAAALHTAHAGVSPGSTARQYS